MSEWVSVSPKNSDAVDNTLEDMVVENLTGILDIYLQRIQIKTEIFFSIEMENGLNKAKQLYVIWRDTITRKVYH